MTLTTHDDQGIPVKLFHADARIPRYGSAGAAGMDVFMPTGGTLLGGRSPESFALGFAMAIPQGFAALLLPRSGVGIQYGLRLHNTCGVIDSDYRGEWRAALTIQGGERLVWDRHDRLLQLLFVPVLGAKLRQIGANEELPGTVRGAGGFGSTGA